MTTSTLNAARTPRRRRPIPFRTAAGRSISYAMVILAVLIFIYPIVWLVSASLKSNPEIYRAPLRLIPRPPQFDAYIEIFRTTPMLRYLINSVTYAIGGAAITVFFSLLAAYGLSRHVFKGKRSVMIGLLAVQLVPGLVRIIPVYIMMTRLNLVDSRFGLILLYGAGGIAYATWFLKGYVDAIPIELDESAWIDGASKLRTVLQIVLPSMIPGLAALLILQFIGHWNNFTIASVLIKTPDYRPLTVATRQLIGPDESDFRLLASASLINVVPILVVFSFLQRFLVSGLTAGAIKG